MGVVVRPRLTTEECQHHHMIGRVRGADPRIAWRRNWRIHPPAIRISTAVPLLPPVALFMVAGLSARRRPNPR